MPLKENSIDVIISLRTLHHVEKPSDFFMEFHRVLTKDGYIIFEIPNKRHLLAIIKYLAIISKFSQIFKPITYLRLSDRGGHPPLLPRFSIPCQLKSAPALRQNCAHLIKKVAPSQVKNTL